MLRNAEPIDEPRVYRWLRRKTMNESRRIAAVAAELLADATGNTREP
ncbi:MAG: hypothetical protein ACREE2_15060 [Stellaceae bacterium]